MDQQHLRAEIRRARMLIIDLKAENVRLETVIERTNSAAWFASHNGRDTTTYAATVQEMQETRSRNQGRISSAEAHINACYRDLDAATHRRIWSIGRR